MWITCAYIAGAVGILGALYVHVAGWDAIHDSTATDDAWLAGRRKVRRHQHS